MSPSRSHILISGGDATYYPMLLELIASVRRFPQGRDCPFGIVDAGLTTAQRAHLEAIGCTVVTAEWHYDFPAGRIRDRGYLRANIAKLFLPDYFPGYEVLVWIDGDAWVQDWEAVDLYIRAARRGRFGIVAQTGRYRQGELTVKWLLGGIARVRSILYKNGRRAGLPADILRPLAVRATLNAGAYALRADAPHWAAFRKWQDRVIHKGHIFTSDQLAMALAVYVDGLPLELLPDWCNYMGPWRFDPAVDRLVEFFLPHRPLGIVHLAGLDRMRRDPACTLPVLDLEDRPHELTLRYPEWERRQAAVASVIGSGTVAAAVAARAPAEPEPV